MWRFFLMFLAIQAVLFTAELTPPVQRVFVQPFTGWLATVSGVIRPLEKAPRTIEVDRDGNHL